jgi:hypothetical protein
MRERKPGSFGWLAEASGGARASRCDFLLAISDASVTTTKPRRLRLISSKTYTSEKEKSEYTCRSQCSSLVQKRSDR